MNETLTLNSLSQFVALGIAVLGLWWRVETRVSGSAHVAQEKADLALSQLHEFKLEVAENYAKNGYLKDVESRLISRFDAIVAELHGMRGDFQDAIVKMAGQGSIRRRRP